VEFEVITVVVIKVTICYRVIPHVVRYPNFGYGQALALTPFLSSFVFVVVPLDVVALFSSLSLSCLA
jgi:hypothetical protein